MKERVHTRVIARGTNDLSRVLYSRDPRFMPRLHDERSFIMIIINFFFFYSNARGPNNWAERLGSRMLYGRYWVRFFADRSTPGHFARQVFPIPRSVIKKLKSVKVPLALS